MNIIVNELVLKYIQNNKKLVITYIILILILFPVKTIILPIYFSNILSIIKDKIKNIATKKNKIIKVLFSLLLIKLFILLLNYFNNKQEGKISATSIIYNRTMMFEKLLILKSNNFNNIKIGETIIRILNVSRSIKYILTIIITKYIPYFLSITCIIIYFFIIDSLLGIIFLILFILFSMIISFNIKDLIKNARKNEDKFLEINEKINDSLNNLFNILINNQIDNQIKENKMYMNEYKNTYINEVNSSNKGNLKFSFFNYFTFIILISYSLLLLFKNKIKIKKFITIFIILTFIYPETNNIIKETSYFIHFLGEVSASKNFLMYILNNKDDKKGYFKINGNISFENIYFKYPSTNKCILCNLNLKIKDKEKIALVGQSGSGKSTLMKLLLGFNTLNKGSIKINSTDIKYINKYNLRKEIIYVNQNTNLFNISILDNILYGNSINKIDIINILNKYNLNKVYEKLDKGIYSQSGPNGLNLSLGMQKVTIILRSIFKKCKIIIFDEPLTGLDENTRMKIIKLIKYECNNKTLIIITHDKEIFPLCNRIISLDKINN